MPSGSELQLAGLNWPRGPTVSPADAPSSSSVQRPRPDFLCSISLPAFKFPWDQGPKSDTDNPNASGTASVKAAAQFPSARSSRGTSAGHSKSLLEPSIKSHNPKTSQNQNSLRQGTLKETADETGSICVERTDGRQRVYRPRNGEDLGKKWEAWEMVEDRHTYAIRCKQLVSSYILPQGYPETVGHCYAPYMFWRAVQYFFGGAMSVFTTSSLLGALGVAGRNSKYKGEASAAINWVIKDGAGRMGRLLFARWGRELDCELKQFRLAGDLLMESGAALELATIFAPGFFLPLACTANLAKNLAAVAASSTRAPIYRTFALSNNLADITAKGESVANLADILGTAAGIALSKFSVPMFPTFCLLSCGYLIASRKEVDSVELPYLNRARLAYSAKKYLEGEGVPGVAEANKNEPLLPWGKYNQRRIVLGSSVEQACSSPGDLALAAKIWRDERTLLTYRSDTKTVHILLLEGSSTTDCVRAAFAAHLFLHLLDGKPVQAQLPANGRRSKASAATVKPKLLSVDVQHEPFAVAAAPWHATMQVARVKVDELLPDFLRLAELHGWNLQQTMLNPRDTRLMQLQPLTLA